jgi:hypothetical protein
MGLPLNLTGPRKESHIVQGSHGSSVQVRTDRGYRYEKKRPNKNIHQLSKPRVDLTVLPVGGPVNALTGLDSVTNTWNRFLGFSEGE